MCFFYLTELTNITETSAAMATAPPAQSVPLLVQPVVVPVPQPNGK
jgi:hypothetical protein